MRRQRGNNWWSWGPTELLVLILASAGGGLVAMLTLPAAQADAATCAVASVHDGDTIRCGSERVRILAIDAPELEDSPRCRSGGNGWCDQALAIRSREALRALLRTGPVEIERKGTDRYGRTLADLSVNGTDVGGYLIAQGLAKPYH